MKLKYYLRGVGIGIIFATIVMAVSGFVHKYNITDEYIIKEARKLGMVMKSEVTGNNGLFGNSGSHGKDETQSTDETRGTEETQRTEEPENGGSQESEVTPSESESQKPVESESNTREHIVIFVESGDYARQVAEKLKEAGIIDDSEAFRKYMGSNGYAYDLHAGNYEIPVDADYKEICEILMGR